MALQLPCSHPPRLCSRAGLCCPNPAVISRDQEHPAAPLSIICALKEYWHIIICTTFNRTHWGNKLSHLPLLVSLVLGGFLLPGGKKSNHEMDRPGTFAAQFILFQQYILDSKCVLVQV